MKKFNVNCILFVFAIVFIIAGALGKLFQSGLKTGTIQMFSAFKHFKVSTMLTAEATIDKTTSEYLSYHAAMMDIDSLKNNLLGTRIVFKDDTTVIKTDSGSLIEPIRKISSSEIEEVVSCIQKLKSVTAENGAEFLYCMAPKKELYEQAPGYIDNFCEKNIKLFLEKMQSTQIPFLNLVDKLNKENVNGSELFYYTDHHWTTKAGFLATASICKELSTRYGFVYNAQYTDLNNYRVSHYTNWFLGSRGKKVGTYFTWHGADDFDLIIPLFETAMTEQQPFKKEMREGSFEETVLFLQNMEKDYYRKTPYSTYSGGDFRLQIMKNNLNPNGKKILLIKDSFAGVVAPFLALQTSELHICDVRNYEYIIGEKMNLEEYIQEIKPDYVIVLYTGINSIKGSNGRYNFF